MRKRIDKFVSLVLTGVMVLACPVLPNNSNYVQAEGIPTEDIRDNIPDNAIQPTIVIGVEGINKTNNMQILLDKVNQVRWQACTAGNVPDPRDTSKFLTEEDYVPLKIGVNCNKAATIRAAEAAIRLDHTRPNGTGATTVLSYLGSTGLLGENLAWTGNTVTRKDQTIICFDSEANEINGWIEEKDNWINYATRESELPAGEQMGHYKSLINPRYQYTGMASFNPTNDNLRWNWTCTAGAYATNDTPIGALPAAQNATYIQKMPVIVSSVQNMDIVGESVLHTNDEIDYDLLAAVYFTGAAANTTVDCPVYEGATWSSSDEEKLSIDEDGKATVKSTGMVTLTAAIGTGTNKKSISRDILIVPEGVEVVSVDNPDMVTVESNKTPVLSKTVVARLSDNSTVNVDAKWDSYDTSKLLTHFKSTEFDVTGSAAGMQVVQRVHVNAAKILGTTPLYSEIVNGKITITHEFAEDEIITTDSGINIKYPQAGINLSNGYMHYAYAVTWDDDSKNYYKRRKGGDFTLTGTVSAYTDDGEVNIPVSQKLHVNPATVTSVQMPTAYTEIETERGTEPTYPTATVTWSNGDVDQDDITWTDKDPSNEYTGLNDSARKYMMKDGGTYDLTGTYSGRTTTITVKVNPATVTSAVIEKPNVETKCGTEPVLPSTAKVTWSNGDKTDEDIVWEELDPEDYNKIEGNSYTVSGTCAGKSVTANITVLPATIKSIDSMSLITSERVDPTPNLPANATVNWSNDTSSEVSVSWSSIEASKYAAPGTFQAVGEITDMYGKKVTVTCDIVVHERTLTSIALENGELENNTSVYKYDLSDIKGAIIATYDNGETEKINITSSMISGFNANSTSSNQEITISYTEGSITKTVKTTLHLVKRIGIEITKLPTKLEYIEGEVDELDYSGIEVKELLDNNEERIISTSDYSVSNFSGFNPNPTIYGNQNITFEYYGFSDDFTVSVKKKTLKSISLSGPTKKAYVQGQEFSIAGLKIYGTYDNGKPAEELPLSDAIIKMNPVLVDDPLRASLGEDVNTNSVGTIEVYVFYPCEIEEGENGQVTSTYLWKTFNISVIEKEIDSIEIKTLPSKQTFPQNDISYEDYKFSDGVILVNYNDGENADVSFSDAAISGFDISKLGNQEVTVSFGEKTVTFNAKVETPTLTKTFVTPPTAVGYAEGESLNLAGTKINLLYDNGLVTDIDLQDAISAGDAEVSFADGSSTTAPLSGNKKLVIKYKGTALKDEAGKDINISVSERTGIRVASDPTKTSYIEGQVLNISGLKLESVFANGKTSEIPSSDYSISDVTGYDSSIIGNQTLTIAVSGFSATFNVSVRKKKMVSLEITSLPTKTSYAAGQPLDISGMSVKAFYDNSTAEVLSCSNDGETPITLANIRMNVGTTGNGDAWSTSTVGDSVTYYVTYKEDYEGAPYIKEAFSLKIEPKVVQSLKVDTMPTDVEYIQNSTAYNSGNAFGSGILKVTNNCGFVEYVGFRDEGVTISGFDISSVGEQAVTVSYGGRSTTFTANVIEPTLTGKTVTPPTKTSYTEGEAVSLAGAAVVKTYDNGLSETIDLSQDAAALEAEGIKIVFVDAAGKEYAANDPSVTTITGAKTLVVKYKTSADGDPEQWEELKMPGGTAVSVNVEKKQENNPSGGNGSGSGSGNGSGLGSGNGSGSGSGSGKGSGSGNGSGTAKKNTLVTSAKGTQFIKADGSYAKNEWVTVKGTKYYFNADSYNASNEWRDGKWISADGSCTYSGQLFWKSNSSGWWVEDTVGWYPQNSWQKIDGVWYYFNSSGYMAAGEWYDGYWFNSDGSWDPTYKLTWKGNSSGWWIEDISGWWPSSCWQKIDGSWYYFDASGYMVTNQYVDGYWIGSDGVCN